MIALGAVLAAVAGAVDVLAFVRLGNVFASVVTGNLVVVGVALSRPDLAILLHAAVAVLAYGAGVVLGSLGAREPPGTAGRWPVRSTVLCAGELVLLLVVTALWMTTGGAPTGVPQYLALAAAALAMALQSAAFRPVRLPGVTTTYFTGTLISLLAELAAAGRFSGPAAVALVALLAGAAAAGLLVAQAADFAVLLPVGLLAAVIVVAVLRRRELAAPRRRR